MKKLMGILMLTFFLYSCFGDSDDVTKAKQEMGVMPKNEIKTIVDNTIVAGNKDKTPIELPTVGDLMDIKNDPRIKITQISGEKLLELDELNYDEFKNGYPTVSGTTLGQVDKIIVSFSNDESDYPSDVFTLKKFKTGDDRFEYNASSEFKVLDFGVNKYRFVAYSGTKKSILELLVVVSKDDKRVLDGNSQVSSYIEENSVNDEIDEVEESSVAFDKSSLPSGSDFGNVVQLGGNSFTYSDIKGLEIVREKVGSVNCGKNDESDKYFITEFLGKKQESWYYWNTCRDIEKGKGISFFVTRLDGDEYVYEKHYIDLNHGLYGTYELSRGGGATSDNLSDKHKELKAKNAEFETLGVVDSLFEKIVN